MCGRFALDLVDLSELPEWLAADHELVVDWQPRFNIAPSQSIPILLARPERTLLGARWGATDSVIFGGRCWGIS
jgi:putative SOS response-associated peptidase YedK